MVLESLVPSSTLRPKSEVLRGGLIHEIGDVVSSTFSPSSLLLLGAAIQGGLVLAIPRVWVLAPTVLLLLVRFFDTLAITFKFRPNPYLKDVINERWTTILPDKSGQSSGQGADEKVAVLLLCAKPNHPLGALAPNFKEVGDFATNMAVELDAGAPANGFLGQSAWSSPDTNGAKEVMLLSYWRSIDDILKYSQSPLHNKAMVWWDQMVTKHPEDMKHIGISHEIFEAPRGKWESVYINMQPTRLGATTFLRKGNKLVGGTVEDQWISPVVAAKGRLRNSKGRLNWAESH